MNKLNDLIKEEATELKNLWDNFGHWGFYEADENANDRTREIIKLYAQEHKTAFLINTNDKIIKPYDAAEMIYNFGYDYIAADRETAETILKHHSAPYEQLFKSLKELERKNLNCVGLLWA